MRHPSVSRRDAGLHYLGLRFVGCTPALSPHLALQLLHQTQHTSDIGGGCLTGIHPHGRSHRDACSLTAHEHRALCQVRFPCRVPTHWSHDTRKQSVSWLQPNRHHQPHTAMWQSVAAACPPMPQPSWCLYMEDLGMGGSGLSTMH